MSRSLGCVALIGSGCGQRDLITLRGLHRLQECDAVVYDDLIDNALLDEAPRTARRIYMGKRSGVHSAPQEEISRTLVELALEGKRVARLKGGDPYVFGRGGEEVMALQRAGVPFEVIPGISSAIAIPAAAGIPVTHRGVSRSFHVVTAHTADRDGLPRDLKELAALSGTLVFLMGLGRLERLMDALMEYGKGENTPAAVISGGNAPHHAVVRGTVKDISLRVREVGVRPPAVIVVGESAGLDLTIGSVTRPLDGICVGITGTERFSARLRDLLEEQGARVVTAQRTILRPIPVGDSLVRLTDGAPHWVGFTSGNGVRRFFACAEEQGLDLRSLSKCKFAVIGAPTGETLWRYGIHADLCPEVFTSEALGIALCDAVAPGEDVVLFRSRQGTDRLPRLLRDQGIRTEEVPIYDLSAEEEKREQRFSYLTFASAGGVAQYFGRYGAIPSGTICVCIGPVTEQALRDRWDGTVLTAPKSTAKYLVETICLDAARRGLGPSAEAE